MDIREIRRTNLRKLIAELAGGSVGRFADDMGFESHTILSQVTGPKHSRNVGHSLARRIEKGARLEQGWMDVDHSKPADTAPVEGGQTARAMKVVQLLERLPDGPRQLAEQFIDELVLPAKKRSRWKK